MVIAFCILHYGKPYLRAAVDALYPQVDKIVILYTPAPSQGFTTNLVCPDRIEDLMKEVEEFTDKIEWVDGNWQYEGDHVEAFRAYTEGFDWAIRFDADEIFPENSVKWYIEQASKTNFKEFRIHFMHFWRSFTRVCTDAQPPLRVYRLNGGEGVGYLDDDYKVFHMGYAQPTKYIEYKMQVQGHRSEWRPDWFAKKWLENAQLDVHPVCYIPPMWNTEWFDKNKMPEVLKKHKYFDDEVIT